MLADRDRHNRIVIAAALAFIMVFTAIAVAWGFELIGGYVPCQLCLEQRVPYYLALPLAAIAIVSAGRRWTVIARVLLVIVAGAALYSAGIGAYQAGAEWAFWEGPQGCAGGPRVDDAAIMLDLIRNTRIVSCTDPSGRFLGLSFAGWNVVAGVGIAVVALAGAAARPKRIGAAEEAEAVRYAEGWHDTRTAAEGKPEPIANTEAEHSESWHDTRSHEASKPPPEPNTEDEHSEGFHDTRSAEASKPPPVENPDTGHSGGWHDTRHIHDDPPPDDRGDRRPDEASKPAPEGGPAADTRPPDPPAPPDRRS
jgi:disulfide bond formation protein DsbB